MDVSDIRRWAVTGAVLTALSLVGAAPLSFAKGGEAEAGKGKAADPVTAEAEAGKGKAADPAGTEAPENEAEAGTVAAATFTAQAGGAGGGGVDPVGGEPVEAPVAGDLPGKTVPVTPVTTNPVV